MNMDSCYKVISAMNDVKETIGNNRRGRTMKNVEKII